MSDGGETPKGDSPDRPTRLEAVAICRSLERDYSDSFAAAGASGLDAWANGAQIGVETRFGERGGSIRATHIRHRRRSGILGLIGPWVPVRTISEAERLLRTDIEDALANVKSGLRPRVFGRGARWK